MEPVEKIIRHEDGKWNVYSHDGSKRLGGPYDTEGEAKNRLREIEYFKRTKGGVKKYSDAQPRDKRGRWSAVGARAAAGARLVGRETGKYSVKAAKALGGVVHMVGSTAWNGTLMGLQMGVNAATNAAGEHAAELLTAAVVASYGALKTRKMKDDGGEVSFDGVGQTFMTALVDGYRVRLQGAVEVKADEVDLAAIPGAGSGREAPWTATSFGGGPGPMSKAGGPKLIAMPVDNFDTDKFVQAVMAALGDKPVEKRQKFQIS